MLQDRPVLENQECEGNYNFKDVTLLCTAAFEAEFGDEAAELELISQQMILQQFKNPDYLQKFTYKEKKYWCTGNFERGYKASDYEDTEFFYITFMMPTDY